MIRVLHLTPRAQRELEQAAEWYANQRHGLDEEFLDAMTQLFETIREFPFRFALIEGTLRQGVGERFQYAAYYRVERTRVVIVGVIHLSRDPKIWLSRN